MKASIDDRKRLFLLAYANRSFEEVATACDHILIAWKDYDRIMIKTLQVGIVTLYARPFGPNRGLGRLGLDFVPNDNLMLHAILMGMRNKTFGHTDSNTTDYFAGFSANNVLFRVKDNHLSFGLEDTIGARELIEDTLKLSLLLMEKSDNDVEKLLSEVKKFPLADGRYQIDLDENSDSWLMPYAEKK